MRFRLLATTCALLLIFLSRLSFGGPIKIGADIDDLENDVDVTEILMQGLADSGEFPSMIGINLLQSLMGTPFSIAPPIVEIVLQTMAIIIEEEEELMVAHGADDVHQRLRPILFSELDFIRLVCDDLTVEQRARIRSAAEASLIQSALEMAPPHEGDRGESSGVLLETRPDPLFEIRKEIDKAMKEVLTAEKYAQYAVRAASRVAHRKQAAILVIVAQLDGDFCLTVEQRNKIMNEISSQWKDEWEQWLDWNWDFTEIPKNLEPIVSPVLDELQASIWKQTRKSDPEKGWLGNEEIASHFRDGWWGEDPPMALDEDGEMEEFPF
jgi:hypothetical protein